MGDNKCTLFLAERVDNDKPVSQLDVLSAVTHVPTLEEQLIVHNNDFLWYLSAGSL